MSDVNINGENKALWMPLICSYAGHCHLVTKVSSSSLATHPAYSGVTHLSQVAHSATCLAISPGTVVSH